MPGVRNNHEPTAQDPALRARRPGAVISPHATARAAQRLALRSGRTRVGRELWLLVFRVIARAAGAYLTWGERGASVYTRGGADEDFLPGLSDIDLALVLAGDPAAPGAARARVVRRWERLRRLPATELVVDWPRIYEHTELRDLAGASSLTYGLDADKGRRPDAADPGSPRGLDASRMLVRPGPFGATADWRLLAGPDRRPREPAMDAQSRRIAAWLELAYWWRWVFPACVEPEGPRAADLCVKFVAEPARIWLWLAHGERASGRADALRRSLRRLPEEEAALSRALALQHSLADAPAAPLDEILPTLLRFSARIAELIAAEVADEGSTEVRLLGGRPDELILPGGGWTPTGSPAGGEEPSLLPLADWRALALPLLPDESLAPLPDDPREPRALGAAAAVSSAGPYPVLRADGLLILPSMPLWRSRLRTIQCPPTDPVSFALLQSGSVAAFPAVRGWSAEDAARRAVAEHRAELPGVSVNANGSALGRLFTAARAALFLESIRGGDPELPLTVVETARLLSGRLPSARAVAEDAVDRYRGFVLGDGEPPERTVSAMRRLVLSLPAYADERPGVHATPAPSA
jgi:hypothetical protein